jgi:hypothetical protein
MAERGFTNWNHHSARLEINRGAKAEFPKPLRSQAHQTTFFGLFFQWGRVAPKALPSLVARDVIGATKSRKRSFRSAPKFVIKACLSALRGQRLNCHLDLAL